jgi:rhodanese-related sulfurtransferase
MENVFQTLYAKQTAEYINSNPNTSIIDLRDKDFFDQSHFDNATFVSLNSIDEFAENFTESEKSQPIVVHCGAGVRSPKASQFLVDNGFTNIIFATEGYKVIKGEISKL